MALAAQSQRVLIVGDVNGHFKQLFDRINAVNKKSPFDMCLCTGNFFSDNDEENNGWMDILTNKSELNIPLTPIYVLGPQNADQTKYYTLSGGSLWQKGFEVLNGQITFLGEQGILVSASGLVIAYATEELTETLEATSQQVDILITSRWPKGVTNFLIKSEDNQVTEPDNASLVISRLAKRLRPRYHVSNSKEFFFERQPFRNHQVLSESSRNVTRFISVAPVSNKLKAKWLYAFNITPTVNLDKLELHKQPDDTTENPYRDLNLNVKPVTAKPDNVQFFYNLESGERNNRQGGRQQNNNNNRQGKKRDFDGEQDNDQQSKRREPKPVLDPMDCWFCLSSPKVEKHLVVSIGDFAYLAAAKGGLTDEHMLIIPIEHKRSTLECHDDLLKEINRFKSALTKYFFKEESKLPIFFERNFRSDHLQIQCVPVSAGLAGEITNIVEKDLTERKLNFKRVPKDIDLKEIFDDAAPYFLIELVDTSIIVFINTKERFFPIQLGRELLASEPLLNVPDRIDWKKCALSEEESKQQIIEFREKFKPHDFTLE